MNFSGWWINNYSLSLNWTLSSTGWCHWTYSSFLPHFPPDFRLMNVLIDWQPHPLPLATTAQFPFLVKYSTYSHPIRKLQSLDDHYVRLSTPFVVCSSSKGGRKPQQRRRNTYSRPDCTHRSRTILLLLSIEWFDKIIEGRSLLFRDNSFPCWPPKSTLD